VVFFFNNLDSLSSFRIHIFQRQISYIRTFCSQYNMIEQKKKMNATLKQKIYCIIGRFFYLTVCKKVNISGAMLSLNLLDLIFSKSISFKCSAANCTAFGRISSIDMLNHGGIP